MASEFAEAIEKQPFTAVSVSHEHSLSRARNTHATYEHFDSLKPRPLWGTSCRGPSEIETTFSYFFLENALTARRFASMQMCE